MAYPRLPKSYLYSRPRNIARSLAPGINHGVGLRRSETCGIEGPGPENLGPERMPPTAACVEMAPLPVHYGAEAHIRDIGGTHHSCSPQTCRPKSVHAEHSPGVVPRAQRPVRQR